MADVAPLHPTSARFSGGTHGPRGCIGAFARMALPARDQAGSATGSAA